MQGVCVRVLSTLSPQISLQWFLLPSYPSCHWFPWDFKLSENLSCSLLIWVQAAARKVDPIFTSFSSPSFLFASSQICIIASFLQPCQAHQGTYFAWSQVFHLFIFAGTRWKGSSAWLGCIAPQSQRTGTAAPLGSTGTKSRCQPSSSWKRFDTCSHGISDQGCPCLSAERVLGSQMSLLFQF